MKKIKDLSFYTRGLPFLIAMGMVIGCDNSKELDETPSFRRTGNKPYDLSILYYALRNHYGNEIVKINRRPIQDLEQPAPKEEGAISNSPSLYLIASENVIMDSTDREALKQFMMHGNYVLVIGSAFRAAYYGDSMALDYAPVIDREADGLIRIYTPAEWHSYSYPGAGSSMYFSDTTGQRSIMGYNSLGKPHFVSSNVGTGRLIEHCDLYRFTNFFLLHGDNFRYLADVFSLLPQDFGQVYWDDYYTSMDREDNSQGNPLRVILAHRATRWAFFVLCFLFVITFLFQARRRKPILAPAPETKNKTAEFFEAVAQLYYSHMHHNTLFNHQLRHFSAWLHQRYGYQSTDLANEATLRDLADLASFPFEDLEPLLVIVKEYRRGSALTDEQIRTAYHIFNRFYHLTK